MPPELRALLDVVLASRECLGAGVAILLAAWRVLRKLDHLDRTVREGFASAASHDATVTSHLANHDSTLIEHEAQLATLEERTTLCLTIHREETQ